MRKIVKSFSGCRRARALDATVKIYEQGSETPRLRSFACERRSLTTHDDTTDESTLKDTEFKSE